MMHSVSEEDISTVAATEQYGAAEVNKLLPLKKQKAGKEVYFYATHYEQLREKLRECYRYFEDPAYVSLLNDELEKEGQDLEKASPRSTQLKILDKVLKQTNLLFAYPNEANLSGYRELILAVRFTTVHSSNKIKKRHTMEGARGIAALTELHEAMEALSDDKFIDALAAHQYVKDIVTKKYAEHTSVKRDVYQVLRFSCDYYKKSPANIECLAKVYEAVYDVLNEPSSSTIQHCLALANSVDGKPSLAWQRFARALKNICLTAAILSACLVLAGFSWMVHEKEWRGAVMMAMGLAATPIFLMLSDINQMTMADSKPQGFAKALGIFANNMRPHALPRLSLRVDPPPRDHFAESFSS